MKINNIREATPKLLNTLKERHGFYFQNNKLTDENICSTYGIYQEMIQKIKKKKGLEVENDELP